MERCPNCGAPTRAGARFCTTCGAGLTNGSQRVSTAVADDAPPAAERPEGVDRRTIEGDDSAADPLGDAIPLAAESTPVSSDDGNTPLEADPPTDQPGADAAAADAWQPVAATEEPGAAWPTTDAPWAAGWGVEAIPALEGSERGGAGASGDDAVEAAPAWPTPWRPENGNAEAGGTGSDGAEAGPSAAEPDDAAAAAVEPLDAEGPMAAPEPAAPGGARAGAAERAIALVDELRVLLAEAVAAGGGEIDAGSIASALEEAVGFRHEDWTDETAALRAALASARERPRDIDTLLTLSDRVPAMLDLLDGHDQLVAAVGTAVGALRREGGAVADPL